MFKQQEKHSQAVHTHTARRKYVHNGLRLLFVLCLLGVQPGLGAQESRQEATNQPSVATDRTGSSPTVNTFTEKPSLGKPAETDNYLIKTSIVLFLILLVLIGLAWLIKRAGLAPNQRRGGFYKILAMSSLGTKEKIALLEVGDTWLMVGITQHSINTLHSMPKNSLDLDTAIAPNLDFAKLLEKIKSRTGKPS